MVFFTSRASRKKVAHVGIYLKDGKFIHASTSQGVIVSNLREKILHPTLALRRKKIKIKLT